MTSIDIFLIVAALFGGLALFLFGMNTMSDSLGKMTGGFLDKVTGFITKNRFSAFLFGTGSRRSCSHLLQSQFSR